MGDGYDLDGVVSEAVDDAVVLIYFLSKVRAIVRPSKAIWTLGTPLMGLFVLIWETTECFR